MLGDLRLRDINGVIQALRRLVELEQVGRVQRQVLGMVTQAWVSRRGRMWLADMPLEAYKTYVTKLEGPRRRW